MTETLLTTDIGVTVQPYNAGTVVDRDDGALNAPGYIASDWWGGVDFQAVYDPTDTSKGAAIWIQRTANAEGLKGAPLGIYVGGEIAAGVETAFQGVRVTMNNYGTGNDCVSLSGRTTNTSDGGMSSGVFGGCGVASDSTASSMGVEGHIYVNHGAATQPRDGSGFNWFTAMHAYSDSVSAAAHYGLLIGSSGNTVGRHGFWNGIGMNGTAFSHSGATGVAGTVGLNMAWTSAYPETGIKFGAVGGYHLSSLNNPLRIGAATVEVESLASASEVVVDGVTSRFAVYGSGDDKGSFGWDGAAIAVCSKAGLPMVFKVGTVELLRLTETNKIKASVAVDAPFLATEPGGNLVIASGSITPTRGFHRIDTEGATSTDDLTTIVTTNIPEGARLVLMSTNNTRDITIKHNVGNIRCGSDKVLATVAHTIEFVHSAGKLYMLSYAANL